MNKIKLVAMDKNDVPVTAHNWKDRIKFVGSKMNISIHPHKEGWTLKTVKGKYLLVKHPTINYFNGVANGHKIHLSVKKMVAELRWW